MISHNYITIMINYIWLWYHMISHVIPWDWIWWVEMSWATRPGSFDERRKRFETPGRGSQVVIPFGVPNGSILGCFFFFKGCFTFWLTGQIPKNTWYIWLYDWILNDIHGEFLDQSYFWIKVIHWIYQNQQYFSSFIYEYIYIYIYIWYIQILYDIIYDIKFADFADLNGPGRTGLGERWAGTWEIRWKGGLLLWRFVDFER